MAVNAIEMSVAEWIEVKDNPRQRNTEKRANLARLGHLRNYCPIHRFVYAATIQGSVVCKLDGHTRALLWQTGDMDPPPEGSVVVLLIEVKSMAEAKAVYDQLDSPPAAKKPCDTVYGACRENRFELSSSLLRSCSFSTQLKIADSGTRFQGDINALVKKWKPHLLELDRLNLSSNYTVLIAFMLVAIRRDGPETAGKFLTALDRNEGVKMTKRQDGVEALHKHIEIRRAEGTTAGYDNLIDLLGRAWSAYTSWLDGKNVQKLHASALPVDSRDSRKEAAV